MPRTLQVSIAGAAICDEPTAELARAAGAALARAGVTLICGGGGGVMAAACAGARAEGGRTVGILAGVDDAATPPNEHLDVVLFTGLHQARNQMNVLSSSAVIAIGGGWGTLSEIALALKFRIPVVLLASWSLRRPDGLADPRMFHARTAEDAVVLALRAVNHDRPVTV